LKNFAFETLLVTGKRFALGFKDQAGEEALDSVSMKEGITQGGSHLRRIIETWRRPSP
jgi:hypothetical protein